MSVVPSNCWLKIKRIVKYLKCDGFTQNFFHPVVEPELIIKVSASELYSYC